jgi:pimeloyl-ACP methyl ester carboxylesterase
VVLAFDGDLEFDPALFEVRRGGVPVPLEPQAFDVLAYLVSHRDRVVPKEELMDGIWGGRFVSETAVTSRIKQVRRALGDDGHSQRMIRTLHGRGYRFVAPVESRSEVRPSEPVRYTVSDGLHIAYQVTGGGELDIVLISGFISHLEQDWGDPRHAHFLHRLGSFGRLIRFDKRGTGMSDRPSGLPDVETRMHDVLSVMDAVGSQRAVLVGYSEGGPMAIMCAATHPEKVAGLVLYGAYAKRVWSEDYPWAQKEEVRKTYSELLVNGWDWEADMRMRCPSADVPMQQWWAQRMRASATPSTIRALLDMNSLVDVRDALPAIRVPTLVLHRVGDGLIDPGGSRYMAEHIPGARLELLDGNDHFVSGDPDQILDPIERFVRDLPGSAGRAVALAAVAAPAGPGAGDLTAGLVAARGRRRSGPGGRPVVVFDGPATAVRAGLAQVHSTDKLGVAIAEIAGDETELDAYGVHVAIALADQAAPGSLWLTSAVRDLLAGSGVVTECVGEQVVGGAEPQAVFRAL